MIITKKIQNFLRTAKSICKDGSVYYSGNKLTAANSLYQVVLNLTNELPVEEIALPVNSLSYLATFDVGDKVDFVMSKDNNSVSIKHGRNKAKFPLGSAIDYSISSSNEKTAVELDVDVLKDLKAVSTAADSSGSPLQTSVTICKENDNLIAYATNGFVLALAPLADNVTSEFSMAHVSKDMLLTTIGSGLLSDTEKIKISMSEKGNALIFENDDALISCACVSCKRFEYQSVFEVIEKNRKSFTFNKEELANSLNKASVLSTTSVAKLSINQDFVEISLAYTLVDFSEYVNIESSEAEPMNIGFNVKFLSTALSVMKAEKLDFAYTGAVSPCYVTDGHIKYLIVPCRLAENA